MNSIDRLAGVCVLFLICAALAGRADDAPPPPGQMPAQARLIPAGNLFQSAALNELAVYLPRGSKSKPDEVLAGLLASEPKYWTRVAKMPKPGEAKQPEFYARVIDDVPKSYAPPDLHALKYFGRGFAAKDEQDLQQCQQAYVIDFVYPTSEKWNALRSATYLTGEVARQGGGWIWDEDSREVFTVDAWVKRRLNDWSPGAAPDLSRQIAIHMYRDQDMVRAITIGMDKFGLPDLVVTDFSWSNSDQVEGLISLVAQGLAEGQQLTQPGKFSLDIDSIKNAKLRERIKGTLLPNATSKAVLGVKEAAWEQGDPKNRLMELTFEAAPGDDNHTRQEALLASLFGSHDKIKMIHHDDELLAESAKERDKLAALQPAFARGLAPGEYLSVKAPFDAPNGQREWMWVEITSWDGDTIKGLLRNDPYYVLNLHSGSTVTVSQKAIFDFIHGFPDGHSEGNTTGPMIEKMEGEEK